MPTLGLAAVPTPVVDDRRSRVLLVASHPLVRTGLRTLVSQASDLAVAAECAVEDLLRPALRRIDADVIVLDVADDAVEVATVHRIASLYPGTPLLVLGDRRDYTRARDVVLAGARGVLDRADAGHRLDEAIRKVRHQELWLERSTVARLVDELVVEQARRSSEPQPELASLTEREAEIVDLVAKGLCNKSIAHELSISSNTVRHHLTSIFAKLGVNDRLALAVYALRRKR